MVGGPRSSPGQEVVALGQLWQGFLTTPENLLSVGLPPRPSPKICVKSLLTGADT